MISIIVPVYNVEQYLDRCIRSLTIQTYEDIEIILVNDGSTDSSGRICDEYAKLDSRIRVIHKSNGGLSEARNVALDVIKGEELMFVDSDDWIHHDLLKIMHQIKDNSRCDMVACFLKSVFEDDASARIIEDDIDIDDIHCAVFTSEEAISKIYVTACAKLYDANIFKTLRYETGRLHEDEFAFHYMMHAAKNVAVIKEELYYYFQRPGSIVHHVNTKRVWDCLDALTDRVLFAHDNWSEILEWSLFVGTEYVIRTYLAKDNGLSELDRQKLFDEWKNIINTYGPGRIPVAFRLFFKKPEYYLVYRKFDRRTITWKQPRTGI